MEFWSLDFRHCRLRVTAILTFTRRAVTCIATLFSKRRLLVHLTITNTDYFFFARSCLGKVPGRAAFSQLSQRATACTIRMQIVKQINGHELDIKKRINQLGQLISKWINKKEMQWDQGCSQVEGGREDRSQQYRHRRGVIGQLEPKLWLMMIVTSEWNIWVPGSGERMRNLTTTGLGEKKWNNGGRLRVLSESTQMFLLISLTLITSSGTLVVHRLFLVATPPSSCNSCEWQYQTWGDLLFLQLKRLKGRDTSADLSSSKAETIIEVPETKRMQVAYMLNVNTPLCLRFQLAVRPSWSAYWPEQVTGKVTRLCPYTNLLPWSGVFPGCGDSGVVQSAEYWSRLSAPLRETWVWLIFQGLPQINNCQMQAANFMMSLRNVSDTFDQGYRGVTPLCHNTAGYISEIKRAEKLVVTWTVLCRIHVNACWLCHASNGLRHTWGCPLRSQHQSIPSCLRGRKWHFASASKEGTVARAYASSSCVCLCSSESFRNFCLPPPMRKFTFVCATTTIKAVIPAQEVALREITCRWIAWPCTKPKIFKHAILIVEHGQVIGWVMAKFNVCLQPFNEGPNITDSVHDTLWDVPEHR